MSSSTTPSLQLSYTTIAAPRDGQTAQRTVNLGDYVKAGQSLLAVVGDERWIIANFKETQLAGMRVGQQRYPDRRRCLSRTANSPAASPASSPVPEASSAALPPENASGNYVKVVQRMPGQDHPPAPRTPTRCHLSPGMSVVPSVRVN